MKWAVQLFKNWSFIAVFISVIFLWYYITFTPNEELDRTFAISLSLAAIIAYITHSTLQAVKIETSLDEMSDEISKGFDFRVVTDRDEFLVLLRSTIREAKSKICVTHFDYNPPETPYRSQERELYWKANHDVIMNDDVSFTRLIAVDSDEKLKWVKGQMDDYKDCSKYNINVISFGGKNPIVMEMLVVDNKTAMFWPATHDRDEVYIWMSGREELISGLQRCFDSINSRSTCVKDGRILNHHNLDKI